MWVFYVTLYHMIKGNNLPKPWLNVCVHAGRGTYFCAGREG